MKRPRRPQAIDQALRDKALLGAALGDTNTWGTWLAVLRASAGLPLSAQQRESFAAVSGDRTPPLQRVRELWCVIGRGGGKSKTSGAIAVHTATLVQHKLSPGEVGYVLCLSQTTAQARIVFDYALAFLQQSPLLRKEIASTTASEIRLHNGLIIATHPNSYRSVRGRTLLAVIFDESSFWRDESSALPDIECYRAVLPSLIRTGGQLIGISSPYRKLGLLYQKHKDYFGVDDPDVLVVQGDSRTFNPTLNERDIAKAIADDPEAGLSEWQGQFRDDIAAFLSEHDIAACVDHDRPLELPPRRDLSYYGFVDPSGGRHDSFTIAIGHRDGDRTIIDVLRGVQPSSYASFDPHPVVGDFAILLKQYGCREVTGDAYAAGWCENAFKDVGIKYRHAELPKGKLYIEGLVSFTRRTVSLPDHPKLLRELRLLERRAHLGGTQTVDHGRNGSDDYANSVFGMLQVAQKRKQGIVCGAIGGYGRITWNDPEPDRCRVRWVRTPKSLAPAARGP